MTEKKYGLIATFDTAPAIFHAAEKVRDAGFEYWDAYTPFPVHGLEKAMGLSRSKVPCFTLAGGLTGFTTGLLIVWFMNMFDYPLIVGGKPFFSPVFPFPVFYELTILLAAFGTLGGMFITNMLPRHNHPVFEYKDFHRSGDDLFMIAIEAKDPKFDDQRTRNFLQEIGGRDISEITEKE
jgi:hypothetical protein